MHGYDELISTDFMIIRGRNAALHLVHGLIAGVLQGQVHHGVLQGTAHIELKGNVVHTLQFGRKKGEK